MSPLGVLRVRPRRAQHLAGVNWQALDAEHFESDPYCIMRLGSSEGRSSTVRGSTNPVWPQQEPSLYFAVYHREQGLEVEALGEDQGGIFGGKRNWTAHLGSLPCTPVGTLLADWPDANRHGQRGHDSVPAAPGPPGSGNAFPNSSRGVSGPAGRAAKLCRVQLDTKNVSKDMLHTNDPVNRGISSELELEIEWFDLCPAPPSPARRMGHPASPSDPIALLMVDIYKGVGFPTEAVSEKKGLRWRSHCEAGGEAAITRRGDLCDVEELEFPDLPIHSRLFTVIDKLVDRGFSMVDVAHIVGAESPELITLYLQQKQEYLQKYQEREQAHQQVDHRVNLQWYEVLPHFVRRPEAATLRLELVDGEDRVVGDIGPLPLGPLLDEASRVTRVTSTSCAVLAKRAAYTLNASAPQAAATGGLGAWFTPARSSAKPADFQRYQTVELQFRARLCFLAPGKAAMSPAAAAAAEAANSAYATGVLPIPA